MIILGILLFGALVAAWYSGYCIGLREGFSRQDACDKWEKKDRQWIEPK